MLLLRDLSFRYKIPLRATVLVLITSFTVTGAIMAREYEQLRHDLFDNAASLGRVLAETLVTPMVHDDVWRTFEIINTPFHTGEETALGAELLMVLDERDRVYVSTQPMRQPILTRLDSLGPQYAGLQARLAMLSLDQPRAVEVAETGHFYLVAPIQLDGVRLGTLIMEYPKSLFVPRFLGIVSRAGWVTLLVLVILLPLSWYWGRRMAQPLLQLADCMGRVGSRIPEEKECRLYESRDEIGQAGAQLRRMLAELRQKQALEQSMVATERLAAIGRLTSGIAHEINNPLGGMLNAISTYKRHGSPEGIAGRTVSLLERGLLQIKDTVGALLVESRLEGHDLTPQDLDDIHTLIQPDAHKRQVTLVWNNAVTGTLPLPSTQVRQALLNLLLNALNASEPGGTIHCDLHIQNKELVLAVVNGGQGIEPERLAHLFEPFTGQGQGHGLGLWVTYQLVQQLGGRIHVESRPGDTRFHVNLPLTRDSKEVS